MATWDEFIRRAYSDVGTAYQQILTQGSVSPTPSYNQQPQAAPAPQINPEYTRMEGLYDAQATERARLAGITEADYQPTNIDYQAYGMDHRQLGHYEPTAEDWQEYGRYLDEREAAYPTPDPEPHDLEPGR